MNKNVLLTIKGIQVLDEESDDPVEIVAAAEYYLRNGKHYIMYEDWDEDCKAATKNAIKITEDVIEIQKKGVVLANLLFKRGEVHTTVFKTPYGEFLVEIDTNNMEVDIAEDNINVKVDYSLTINKQHIADNEITVTVKNRI